MGTTGLDLSGVPKPGQPGWINPFAGLDLGNAPAAAPAQPAAAPQPVAAAPLVDPFAGLDLKGGAAPPAPAQAAPAGGSALNNFGSALFHHLGNALHGTAQIVERGLAKGADWIDQMPQGLTSVVTGQRARAPWNQALQNTVASDDAALAKREADYQASTPDNAASYAGAAAGEVAPFLIGGVGSGLRKVGDVAGSLATRGLSAVEPYVPATLSRWLPRVASGAAQGATVAAAQPVTTPDDYWQNKGGQLQTGATLGGVMPLAGAAASEVRNAVGAVLPKVLGASTGVGADAVQAAYQAGKAGDTAFTANMRGQVPMQDVLDQARAGLAQMRADRAAAYRSGMVDISADKTVLDMTPIQQAVNNLQSTGFFKGQPIRKNAAGTVQDLADQVNHWTSLDPAEYHTPEGLDALKQSIGDIRDATQFGTPGRKAADTVYNAVKAQIGAQAPTYAKTMQAYADASDQLNEITRALSLGERASADTALRKLQSVLRNNAQTNYGNRLDAVRALKDQGGVSLIPSLAGQAMNSWTPRGLTGGAEKAGGFLAAVLHPASIPSMLAAAPFASPRIVGMGAYALGRATGGVNRAGAMLPQIPILPPALRGAMLSSATGPSTRAPTIAEVYGRQ